MESIRINPTNQPPLPPELNFISKNSPVDVAVSVEIPMQLRVAGLTVTDTINFAGLPFTDGIEHFTIKANIHNAFPLGAAVFLHFLDSTQQIIDSVKISDIAGAQVQVDSLTGNVTKTEPTISQIEINLSKDQIESLVDTRYFLVKGILNTSDHDKAGVFVSIYENGETEGFLRVMIGCRLKASGKLISSFSDIVDQIKK
jgi:hypothetical protein